MSRKKTKNRVPAHIKEIVHERSDYICEAMIREAGCTWKATDIHHRKLRSQGGEHTTVNCVFICRECHHYIHMHPAISYYNGWLVKSSHDPAKAPFKRRGSFVQLMEDGEMTGI